MHVNMFLIVSYNQALLIEKIYEPNAIKPAITLDLGSAVICIVFSHARYWEGIQASFTDIYILQSSGIQDPLKNLAKDQADRGSNATFYQEDL